MPTGKISFWPWPHGMWDHSSLTRDKRVPPVPPAKQEIHRRYSLIPGLGRSPGEGNGNPLQYSCLGNPMNRGAWWATFQGVINELDMTE